MKMPPELKDMSLREFVRVLCPDVDPDTVNDAMTIGELQNLRGRQPYGATHVIGLVRQGLARAGQVVDAREVEQKIRDGRIAIGIDYGSGDYTAIAVVRREPDGAHCIEGLHVEAMVVDDPIGGES